MGQEGYPPGARASWKVGTLPAELANLDIAVATRRDESGETLIRELQRTRARVRHLWPAPDLLPGDADVLFCDLVPGLPSRLPWLPGEPKSALVLLIPPAPPPDLELVRNCAPDALLHRPFATHAVLTALVLARTRFNYERRLRSRIARLDETLRVIRSVERAKTILMNTQKITEDEAYHAIRHQAMERRVSIGAVAAAIVDSHEILG
jgi:AmiR/NasT family two-component response regulator